MKTIRAICNNFIIFISITCFSYKTYGDDILEYLAKAYSSSNFLKQAQMQFKNKVESYPSAISTFLPNITYSISQQTSKIDKIPTSGVVESDDLKDGLKDGLKVAIPIFNGGGSLAAVRMAQNAYYSSRLDWYSNEQKFLFDSIKVYIEYYAALQSYNISSTAVEASKKSLESTEAKLSLGEATKTDLASVQSTYSQTLFQRSEAYSKLITAKSNFITTFGTDDENIILPEIPDLNVSSQEELEAKMIENNFDLNKAKYEVNIAKLSIAKTASELAPTVAANLNVSNVKGVNYYSGSLGVNIPIFNSSNNSYSKTRQAKNDFRGANYKLNDTKNNTRNSSKTLWSTIDSYKLQVQYSKEASEAGKLVYEGVVKQEAVGDKTILDVLDAQTKWYSYQINHIEAQKGYLIAAYTIKQSIGELTAQALGLKVERFEPEKEFDKIKLKVVGF
jgi:outer membrane protein